MSKIALTDRFVKTRQPAKVGERDEYADALMPGLVLMVTETGHRSFVLRTRYPSHPKNPTRRSLGTYGRITLDEAREKARRWYKLIERGVDPAIEEERERAASQTTQANTFGAVAGEFLKRHAAGLKKADEARKIVEREFVKRWGSRPITDIAPREVAEAIRAIVERGAPYQAHNALGYVRRLFNWAIGTSEFGIDRSPDEKLKPRDLLGAREARERVLKDDELRAVWGAAGDMGYPYGAIFRLLVLTGQREREVADASWSEIDLTKRMWTIPSSRMKGGRAHEVPLSPAAVGLLEGLPRWAGGDFMFTTTGGTKPINGFSKAKARIDNLSGVTDWKIHDLRRSMRTHLSALPVQDMVRELVIAHAKPGLHKVYDQHAYQDEKRQCLDLWDKRLSLIINPPPDSVVTLPQRGAA
jgi:integrase